MTKWDEACDVLAVGSGGGLAGAYTASREGFDVIVIEATDKYGGTTAYSGGGGMWFPCNAVLRRGRGRRHHRGCAGVLPISGG